MGNKLATVAFGACFAIALFAASRAQQIGGGGGGSSSGGTPCTTTALSLQFNSAGSFGCATEWIYTSAKKSLGDGTNFQIYWSAGNGDFEFRNSADSGYVPVQNGAMFAQGNVSIKAGSVLGVGAIFNPSTAPMIIAPDASTLARPGVYGVSTANYGWASSSSDASTQDTGLTRNAAGVVEANNGTPGTYREAKLRSLVVGGTVPGISGCTAGTQTGGATAGTFASGTSGVCTVTLTFAFTAPTGWNCSVNNQTTANLIRQTGGSTTTAVVAGTTVSGDVISFGCVAF